MSTPAPIFLIRIFYVLVATVLAFACFGLVHSSVAEAQNATCTKLERQLASAGKRRISKKHQSAARRKRKSLKRVVSQLQQFRCKARAGWFSRESPSCKPLRRKYGSLKRQLSALENRAGKGSSRSKIKRAMRRYGCDGKLRTASVKRRSILEQVFGTREANRRRQQAREDRKALRNLKKRRKSERSAEDTLRNYNTVRTVCVRTCDGYYFPVSFSTKRNAIDDDALACSNLCPGRDMELYYHKTSGETAEQMVSMMTGDPYTALPTANSFREKYHPRCGCDYSLLKPEKAEPDQPQLEKIAADNEQHYFVEGRIATPAWRYDPNAEASLLANTDASSGLNAAQNKNQNNSKLAQNRRVRVIGESYFPTQ